MDSTMHIGTFRSGPFGGQVGWVAEALTVDAYDDQRIESPEAAAEVVVPALANMDREAALLMTLTTKHAVIATHIVSVGSIDHTFMTPREILRLALLDNAAAIIVAHNHPSGDGGESDDDRTVTRRINQAAEMVGVDLLDHIVVAGYGWTSLARKGVI